MTIDVQQQSVPLLGLGTYKLHGEACVRTVREALQLGYRHVDTAQFYQNEEEVGVALRQAGVARDEVFLVTKVWPDQFRYQDAQRSARNSLRKLGTHVDLLLLHWPNPGVPVEETLSALKVLQDEGQVRHLGVSNFSTEQVLEAQRHARIFGNQVPFHPRHPQEALLAQSHEQGYLLTAYSPLAVGELAGEPVLEDIGARHGKSWAQVTLRWIVQQGVAAIPKAGRAEHLRANLDIFDFTLSNEEMNAVAALGVTSR